MVVSKEGSSKGSKSSISRESKRKQPVSKGKQLKSTYNPNVFDNIKAVKNFNSLMKKKPIIGMRGFQPGFGKVDEIKSIVEDLKWGAIVMERQSGGNLTMACEFLANMAVSKDKNNVSVRGRAVDASPKGINSVLKVPKVLVKDCAFQKMVDEEVDIDALESTLGLHEGCIKGRDRGAYILYRQHMNYLSRIWMHWTSASLLPSSHRGDMGLEKMQLIYCIVTRKPINVGKILHDQFRKAMDRRGIALVPLITQICEAAGVKHKKDDVLCMPGPPLTKISIQRMKPDAKELEALVPVKEPAKKPRHSKYFQTFASASTLLEETTKLRRYRKGMKTQFKHAMSYMFSMTRKIH